MTLVSVPAIAGLAFDTDQDVTPQQADELWSYGFRTAFLYVPLPGLKPGPGDATAAKVTMLASKGWQLSWVQHPRLPQWDPTAHDGAHDAEVAYQYAASCGFPDGIHGWQDLEGPKDGTTTAALKKFVEDFAGRLAVLSGPLPDGRAPGAVYVGYGLPFDAQDLYLLHGVTCYWSDAGHRSVQKRGCAVHQGSVAVVADTKLDRDTVGHDLLGDVPYVATLTP